METTKHRQKRCGEQKWNIDEGKRARKRYKKASESTFNQA